MIDQKIRLHQYENPDITIQQSSEDTENSEALEKGSNLDKTWRL
jgi:hypothetical protein